MIKIESLQNEKIKRIIKLRKPSERREAGLIVIEGKKEIEMALVGGVEVQEFYFCPEIGHIAGRRSNVWPPSGIGEEKTIEVSREVFQKMSYRDTPDGFLAVFKNLKIQELKNLKNLKIDKNFLIIILESVEKPGNLGAILRTADAVGADAVIINDSQTDIYNPNVIRASRGTIFTVPLAIADVPETQEWLKKNKIKSFAATDKAKKDYTKIDFKKSCAIVLGSEDKGLSEKWLDGADELVKISMNGKIDSLNVSVAGAVIAFEARRQRMVANK
jgi:TrmH family RNA methyltransferase